MSKQTKNLTILTIAMVILNVILLTLVFLDIDDIYERRKDGKQRDRREHFEGRMAKRLRLNDAQKEAFEKLQVAHRKEFSSISKAIFDTKKQIAESLAADNEEQAQMLLAQLEKLHGTRERQSFNHTKAIMAILDASQRQTFLMTLNKAGDDHRRKRRRWKDD